MNQPKDVPATIRSSTGPSRDCDGVGIWSDGIEVEPINLEKKPPALAGYRGAGARLIVTVATEGDEGIDTRDFSEGLCARLLGRDCDDGSLTDSVGMGS